MLGLNPSEEHHRTYLDVEPVRASVSVIYPDSAAAALTLTSCDVFPPDNRVYFEVCQENPNQHDVRPIKGHLVRGASLCYNYACTLRR